MQRMTSVMRLWLLGGLALGLATACFPDADELEYACATDDDCGEGWSCQKSGPSATSGECVEGEAQAYSCDSGEPFCDPPANTLCCAASEICKSGRCCTEDTDVGCYNGEHIYHYDSCGNRGDIKQECTTGCDLEATTCRDCVPNCTGKECGADGCGGICGVCGENGSCEPVEFKCYCTYNKCNAAPVDPEIEPAPEGEVAKVCCLKDEECHELFGDCCMRSCVGKQCGDDGCGGSCDTCPEGKMCSDEFKCVCDPQCGDKVCGPDACGGECGTCDPGSECDDDGQCVCVPQCEGKACGPDGCGGECGACEQGTECDAEGQCQCAPQCEGKVCGPDGCGGECGACEGGEVCLDGACGAALNCNQVFDCAQACAGDEACAVACAASGSPEAQAQYATLEGCLGDACPAGSPAGCIDDAMAGPCAPAAAVCFGCEPECDGKTCGDDGCAGSCGDCPAEHECQAGQCEPAACQPGCEGRQCGDDGCGGTCGLCTVPPETCVGGFCAPVETCAAVLACYGLCADDLGCQDACEADAPNEAQTQFSALEACVDVACPDGEPTCIEGAFTGDCQDQHLACTDCAAVCTNDAGGLMTCGPDGCGGSCGACPEGWCDLDGVCQPHGLCGDGACDPDAHENLWNCPADCP